MLSRPAKKPTIWDGIEEVPLNPGEFEDMFNAVQKVAEEPTDTNNNNEEAGGKAPPKVLKQLKDNRR